MRPDASPIVLQGFTELRSRVESLGLLMRKWLLYIFISSFFSWNTLSPLPLRQNKTEIKREAELLQLKPMVLIPSAVPSGFLCLCLEVSALLHYEGFSPYGNSTGGGTETLLLVRIRTPHKRVSGNSVDRRQGVGGGWLPSGSLAAMEEELSDFFECQRRDNSRSKRGFGTERADVIGAAVYQETHGATQCLCCSVTLWKLSLQVTESTTVCGTPSASTAGIYTSP